MLLIAVVPEELLPIKVPFVIVNVDIVNVPSLVPEKPVSVPPVIVTAAMLFVCVPVDDMQRLLFALEPTVRVLMTLKALSSIFTIAN